MHITVGLREMKAVFILLDSLAIRHESVTENQMDSDDVQHA